jgi:tetratricopeptide (TPR) repeat protein
MTLPGLEQEHRARSDDDPRLLYYLGRQLNRQGRFAEADPILRRAVGLDPDTPRLRDEWARALLGSGLVTAAFGQLQQYAGTHPNLADAHLLLGKFYVNQKSMRRAEEELERAVALNPGLADGWRYLTIAREGLGDAQRARDAAERAVALRQDSVGDRLRLASLLERVGTPDETRRAYEEALRIGPQRASAHREYALWRLKAGAGPQDWQQAVTEARCAVSLDAGDANAQLALGRALARTGQDAAAIAPLRRAAELAPVNPAPALALAQVLWKRGLRNAAQVWEQSYQSRIEQVDAERALTDAIQRNPDAREPHLRLARLLAVRGDVAGCVRHQAAALHRALDSPPVMAAAANDLTEAGHAALALPLARRAVAIGRHSPGAYEALGNALLGTGNPREAAACYDRVTVWWPDRYAAYRERLDRYFRQQAADRRSPAAQAYQESRRRLRSLVGPVRIPREVEQLAQQAATLEPNNPVYLRHLLAVQFRLGRRDAAIQTASDLLSAAPEDAKAHALMAVLLVEQAKTPEDLARVEAHLTAASDEAASAVRHYGRGLLALRRRQGNVAARELREAIRLDPGPDIAYYKLAAAETMAGHPEAAADAMAQFRRRREAMQAEADALRMAAQADDPKAYARAADLLDAHGHHPQAEAVRAEASQRFAAKSAALPEARRKNAPDAR